jgi:hypothetical protein
MYLTSEPYESDKFGNVYIFGYKFNDNAPSNIRTQFLHMLRGIGTLQFDEANKRRFVEKPLVALSKKIPLRDISCAVYPHSKRSDLNRYQIGVVSRYMDVKLISFEIIKNDVKKITFDYDGFFGKNNYTSKQEIQVRGVIDDMLNKIHNSDYFSIAEPKTKYRDFFRNYFILPDNIKLLGRYDKVLLIDDIVTSGATLFELIKIIKTINPDISIYIYSIIGRE